jgi:hypothetical protein
MGDQEEERKEPRKIMVNSDEEIVEALKKINETLKVKEERKTILQEKLNIEDGRNSKTKRIFNGRRRERHN